MADDDGPQQTAEEIAVELFDMLDKDGGGYITEMELVEALEGMNLPVRRPRAACAARALPPSASPCATLRVRGAALEGEATTHGTRWRSRSARSGLTV
eukprot:3430666-Prymnesium_polylepis.1